MGPLALLGTTLVWLCFSAYVSAGHPARLFLGSAAWFAFLWTALIAREMFWLHGDTLIRTLALLGFLLGLLALLQALGLDPLYREASPHLAVATLGNTNAFAAVAAPLLSLVAAEALREQRRSARVFLLATLLFLSGALAVARSRGGWLAALCGLAVAVLTARPILFSRRGAALLITVVAGAAAGLGLQSARSESRDLPLGLGLQKISNQVRLSVMQSTFEMIAARPLLGWGPAQFDVVYPRFRDAAEAAVPTRGGAASYVSHPHNEPLHLLSEGGIPAFSMAAAAVLWSVWHLLRTRSAHRGDDDRRRWSMTAALVAIGASSMTWSTGWDPATAVLLATLLGAALASRVEIDEAPRGPAGLAMLASVTLAAALAAAAAPALYAELLQRAAIQSGVLDEDSFQELARAAAIDRFSVDRQQAVGFQFLRAAKEVPARADEMLSKARACYQRAVRLHQNHVASLRALAEIDLRSGDPAGALGRFRRIAVLEPWSGDARSQLAQLQEHLGMHLDAARTRGLHQSPEALARTFVQVEGLLSQGMAQEAARILDTLGEVPGDARYYQLLSRCFEDLGDEKGHRDADRNAQLSWALESVKIGREESDPIRAAQCFREARNSLERAARYDLAASNRALLEAWVTFHESGSRRTIEHLSRLEPGALVRVDGWIADAVADLWKIPGIAAQLRRLRLPRVE